MPFGATTYDSPYLKALADRSGPLIIGTSSTTSVPDPLALSGDITAHDGNTTQTTIGSVGPSTEAGIAFGSSGDVRLYRLAANILATDDTVGLVTQGGTAPTASRLSVYPDYAVLGANTGEIVLPGNATTELGLHQNLRWDNANSRWDLLETGAGGSLELYEGALYFSPVASAAAGTHPTLSHRFSVGNDGSVYASDNLPSVVVLGAMGPSGEAGIIFGSGLDVNLYRVVANTLATDDAFSAGGAYLECTGGDVWGRSGLAAQTNIGAGGPSGEAGIQFGLAQDTNLYRSAANTLKTDDSFVAGGTLSIGASGGTLISGTGTPEGAVTASVGALYLRTDGGSGTTLYTKESGAGNTGWVTVAGSATVPDPLTLSSDITVRNTLASEVKVGAVGPSSEAGIAFGSALDTNLFRSAADFLATSGSLDVRDTLVVNSGDGAPSGAGSSLMFGSGWSSRIYANVGGTTYLSIDKSPPAADDTTKIATTAWVNANAGSAGRGYIYADDYADLATAVAAASAGECVFLTPGVTYTVSGSTLTIPYGVSLYSPCAFRGAYGAGGAYVTGSVSTLVTFGDDGGSPNPVAGKQSIEGITFASTASGTNAYIFAFTFTGSNILSWVRFYDCMFAMAGSTATNRGAIWFAWSGSGTVEELYFEYCGFQGCDTAIGGSDTTYTSDFDKFAIEKCRFDESRGTSTMPAQVYLGQGYCRGGAIRDCVFQGATDNARAAIGLECQFLGFTIDNCFFGGMASQANNTYDEIYVSDPRGGSAPTGGVGLVLNCCRMGDREGSSNNQRHSLNLEGLGGQFVDSVLTASCLVTGCYMGNIYLSRAYGTPADSCDIFATSCTTS